MELKRVENGKFFVLVEGEDREQIHTDEWNNIEGPSTTIPGQWLAYSPHIYSHSFPLWQGKKWRGDYAVRSLRGAFVVTSSNSTMYGEATKWETMTVLAGTFQALRIEVELQVPVANRRYQSKCWYAAEAQRPVKCEGDLGRYELVRFELK